MTILSVNSLNEALTRFVERNDTSAFDDVVEWVYLVHTYLSPYSTVKKI